jgi:dihydroorotase
MPNTSPPVDSPEAVTSLRERYSKEGSLEIFIAPAISKGRGGTTAADWRGMLQAGGVAFTDDGDWVADEALMRGILEFSGGNNIPVLSHAENKALHDGGVVQKGYASTYFRVPGIPSKSEAAAVRRDIELCATTGGRLHIQHISTEEAVDLVTKAKSEGLAVTCEATPHHLLLTEEDVIKLGPNGKMNPPLRNEHDRRALVGGLIDGTVDIIATDHAPHTVEEKKKDMREAPFGITGLETMFASLHDKLVLPGKISLAKLIELITSKPRKLFNLTPISLQAGSRADLAVIDPECNWHVKEEDFLSKGKNSPFVNNFFTGKVVCTIHRGKVVFRTDDFPEV